MPPPPRLASHFQSVNMSECSHRRRRANRPLLLNDCNQFSPCWTETERTARRRRTGDKARGHACQSSVQCVCVPDSQTWRVQQHIYGLRRCQFQRGVDLVLQRVGGRLWDHHRHWRRSGIMTGGQRAHTRKKTKKTPHRR